jgi:hypothetical protein
VADAVLECEAEPEPVAEAEPEEETSSAIRSLVSIIFYNIVPVASQSRSRPRYTSNYIAIKRSKLTVNTSVTANLLKRLHRSLGVLSTELLYLGVQVLGFAHGLDIGRVGVFVDGTEKAARRRGNSKLNESDESRGEDGTAVHFGSL